MLALQLPLSCNNRLYEFAFRRIFEFEVQAFNERAARLECLTQLDMHLGLARKALEVIKYNNVILVRLRIEVAQQSHHAGAFHEIAPARCIIRKDGFDIVAALHRIGAAALFLALKATAVDLLLCRRNPAVNYCPKLDFSSFLFTGHLASFLHGIV